MESQPLLHMEKVSKLFPGVQALEQVDFEVYPGEILGLSFTCAKEECVVKTLNKPTTNPAKK